MPEVTQVHIDTALTNVSLAYRNDDFVADQIAPRVAVRRQSDRYFVYDPEREWMRASQDRRSPGAETTELDFKLSSDSYFCEDHALSATIPDEERENADPVLQPDIDRVEFLTERLMLNREFDLRQRLDAAPSPQVDVASSDPWNSPTSDPLAQVRTGHTAIMQATQRRANTLVLPWAVFDALRNHPGVVDRVKYTSGGSIGSEVLANLFDVDRVVVARASINYAQKGQSANVLPIWGSNAYLLHVPARAGLKQVAAAYTFVWTSAAGAQDGVVVERWREARRKADAVRVQMYYDHRVVAPGAQFRFMNCLA